MTTTVATRLAVLLGDTIDRSHYVWRNNEPRPRCMRAWVYSCTDWDASCKEGNTWLSH